MAGPEQFVLFQFDCISRKDFQSLFDDCSFHSLGIFYWTFFWFPILSDIEEPNGKCKFGAVWSSILKSSQTYSTNFISKFYKQINKLLCFWVLISVSLAYTWKCMPSMMCEMISRYRTEYPANYFCLSCTIGNLSVSKFFIGSITMKSAWSRSISMSSIHGSHFCLNVIKDKSNFGYLKTLNITEACIWQPLSKCEPLVQLSC